ncbi:Homeodomain-like protein, partial [Bombardia bombarda]
WRELAKMVPGRTNKDCRRRWWNSIAGGTAKGPWTESEDERLISAVRECGTRWSQVAKAVGSRNSDQCSSHWSQALNPDINYSDWTESEDDRLWQEVQGFGTNWITIASLHAPKRTTLALKNRY